MTGNGCNAAGGWQEQLTDVGSARDVLKFLGFLKLEFLGNRQSGGKINLGGSRTNLTHIFVG